MFSEEGDNAQHPYRGFDTYPPGTTKFLMDQVTESARLIHLSVAEEIVDGLRGDVVVEFDRVGRRVPSSLFVGVKAKIRGEF